MSRQKRYDDLTGKRFGIVTAIAYAGRIRRTAMWRVRCDCGKTVTMQRGNLLKTKSCGCLIPKLCGERFTTHGLTRVGKRHSLYTTYDGMIRRCHGKHKANRWYKNCGIAVCNRWRFGTKMLTGFECFLKDMGPRPKGQSINRIDNNGNYSPFNCEWATITDQQRNRSSNHHVKFQGRKMTMIEAIELSGLNEHTVWGRLHLGWTELRALTTPVMR